MNTNRWPLLFALAAMACGCGDSKTTDRGPDPGTDAGTDPGADSGTKPTGKSSVVVSIASVSLADDCPDALPKNETQADICADPGCGPLCDQSSMHLAFVSDLVADAAPRKVTITAARLLDADTGKVLDDLTPREPAIWTMDAYSPWDEKLTSANVQALYKLSQPDWGTIGADWDASFILEVDLEIDGAKNTVKSDVVQREPEIVT